MGIKSALSESYQANSIVYFILAASVIELIAASLNCRPENNLNPCTNSFNAWAVAVGAISTGFTFIFAVLTFFINSMAERVAVPLSVFLVILWIPGAFVTTFNSPFTATGNGYYAAWAAFFFSVGFMQQVGVFQFTKRDTFEADTGPAAVGGHQSIPQGPPLSSAAV